MELSGPSSTTISSVVNCGITSIIAYVEAIVFITKVTIPALWPINGVQMLPSNAAIYGFCEQWIVPTADKPNVFSKKVSSFFDALKVVGYLGKGLTSINSLKQFA